MYKLKGNHKHHLKSNLRRCLKVTTGYTYRSFGGYSFSGARGYSSGYSFGRAKGEPSGGYIIYRLLDFCSIFKNAFSSLLVYLFLGGVVAVVVFSYPLVYVKFPSRNLKRWNTLKE